MKNTQNSNSEEKVESDDERAFLDALFHTQSYIPKHEEFEIPELDSGLAWAVGLETRTWAFDHFRAFPDYVHQFSGPTSVCDIGPWRLEQRGDTFAKEHGKDAYRNGPTLALKYRIFYNSIEIGELQLVPYSIDRSWLQGRFAECGVTVLIDWAPIFAFEQIAGFLSVVTEPLSYDARGNVSLLRLIQVNRSINHVIWESLRLQSKQVRLNFGHVGYLRLDVGL